MNFGAVTKSERKLSGSCRGFNAADTGKFILSLRTGGVGICVDGINEWSVRYVCL